MRKERNQTVTFNLQRIYFTFNKIYSKTKCYQLSQIADLLALKLHNTTNWSVTSQNWYALSDIMLLCSEYPIESVQQVHNKYRLPIIHSVYAESTFTLKLSETVTQIILAYLASIL